MNCARPELERTTRVSGSSAAPAAQADPKIIAAATRLRIEVAGRRMCYLPFGFGNVSAGYEANWPTSMQCGRALICGACFTVPTVCGDPAAGVFPVSARV